MKQILSLLATFAIFLIGGAYSLTTQQLMTISEFYLIITIVLCTELITIILVTKR